MLTVWGRSNSINVQKVMWTIGELDLPHQRIPTAGSFKGNDTPAYLAMNPNGLVPVLQDGEAILWESNAIVRYLAARYGEGGLWPTDAVARARADRWMDWAMGDITPVISPVFFGTVRTSRSSQDRQGLESAIARLHKTFQRLDEALSTSAFIAGDQLSIGDIPIGAYVARYLRMPIELPKLAHMRAYFDRLSLRPAFNTHVMIPFGDCAEEWNALESQFG